MVVVTGIPGVGKTTVLNELKEVAKQDKFDLTVLNYGTIMNEIMRQVAKDMHRDEMRRQSIEIQKKVQELAANEITNRARNSVAVIDTHMFVRTSSGMWAGLPQRVLEKLTPRLLVLVETDPEQIAVRRRGDADRKRDHTLSDEIAFDLEWSRATAAASAVLTGAPVKVIRNDTGRQRQAAQELFEAIRSVTEGEV
jgi:adenylate kinase